MRTKRFVNLLFVLIYILVLTTRGQAQFLSAGSIFPTEQNIFSGDRPAELSGYPASGGDCGGSYFYSWEYSTNNTNWYGLSASGQAFSPGPLSTTTYFRRKVTCGSQTAYSNEVVVKVHTHLSGGGSVSPSSLTISYNTAPGQLAGIAPTGGTCSPNYSYQWQSATLLGVWSTIQGATGPNYSPGPLTTTTYFHRVVTCGTESASGNTVTVTVMPQLTAGTATPSAVTVAYNTSPGQLSCTASSGGNCGGSYVYQWQRSNDNVTYTDLGVSTQNYTPGNLTASVYYRRRTTCGSETAYSNVVRITVNPQVTDGTISAANTTITYNTSPGQITGTAPTGGSCGGSYTYQWQRSSDNVSYTDVGVSTQSYTPGALTASTYFRRKATCGSDITYTNVLLITVKPALKAGTPSASVTIAYNTAPGQLSGGTASGGNCGTSYVYIWQRSTDNVNFTDINGATATTYSPGNLVATTYYRLKITCGIETAYTSVITVTVTAPLAGGTVSPATVTINYGQSPGQLTGGAPAGGNCGGAYTYRWQVSNDGTNFTDIQDATLLNYTPGSLREKTWFRRKTVCALETAYTPVVTVNVNPAVIPGTVTPSSNTVVSGTGPWIINAGPATGGACGGSYSYLWQRSTDDGTTFSDITGSTGLSYTISNLTATTFYRLRVTCGTAVAYTNTAAFTVVGSIVTTDLNFIKVREIVRGSITDVTAADALSDPAAVKQTTQYFDGLGRLTQTVGKQTSPLKKDIVTPAIYDEYGREQTKYLPYIAATADGNYKPNALAEQNNFNAAMFPGEQFYYGQVNYESSPLNRVAASYAPGQNWVGSRRGVENKYWFNTAADDVKEWTVADVAGGWGTYSVNGAYPAGQLYKYATVDEHGKQQIEFKDKEGNVLLKKVQLTATPDDGKGVGYDGWLCTYYVYDDLGNLRLVVQPNGVGLLLQNSWNINALSGAILNEQSFRYEYDHHRRMIAKRTPGAGEVYMVYDVRDRLVFTQDANQRSASQWLTTLYDGLNRPVLTGLITYNGDRDELQTLVNNQTAATLPPGLLENLVLNTSTSGGTYNATGSITMDPGFETATGADMVAEIVTRADGSDGEVTIIEGTAVNKNPLPAGSNLSVLTITYYDNYDWAAPLAASLKDFNIGYASSYFLTASNSTWPYPQAVQRSSHTRGMVTGTKVKVLGSNPVQYLTTVNFYDLKGRMAQRRTQNITNGVDIMTTQYNWSGLPLVAVQQQQKGGANAQTHIVADKLSYDHLGRLLTVAKTVNSTMQGHTVTKSEQVILQQEYNELGQVIKKSLGSPVLDFLSYDYNIRGWLTGINKNYLSGSSSNYFGMELGYDKTSTVPATTTFTTPQFNGNINGTIWKSRGDGINRKYDFTYDAANRLTGAAFVQNNTGSTWNNAVKDFSVGNLSYDANGNIGSMTQNGMTGATSGTIDQLTYRYLPNSNKLAAVTDPINTTSAKLGDFINGANTGDDYAYDDNGNLTKDLNKNITAITHNHLNLPELITITGKGSIRYQYDAAGNKLRKIVTDNSASPSKTTTTDYIGGFVYRDDVLELISHADGRIRPVFPTGQPPEYYYDYFLKDHLGNVRSVLTEQTDLSVYTATMETENATTEAALFSNVEETRTKKPAGYPQDEAAAGSNQYVAKLNAKDGGKKIGPSLVLKVMAGDTIQIGARAFYKSTGPKDNKTVSPEDMVAGLLQAFGGEAGSNASHAGPQGSRSTPFGNFNANDYQRLKEKDPAQLHQDKPKAYLNFVLFDDQFNLVETNSGVRQVKGEPDQLQTLAVDKMPIEKSGFLYVYTSNETQQDVLFDNVTVAAISGPLLEETHYYPYGLTMAGISSNALTGTDYRENRLRYNGKELQSKEFRDGSGLEWYDYGARMYDQQIGRWHAHDPLAAKWSSYSPYNYTLNSPVNNVDPDGKDVRISIKRDDDGNWMITLSSTIYVTGFEAEQRVTEYNKFIQDHPNLMSNKKHADGTTTTINLDFKYELATDKDIARIKDEKTRNGDNLLELENSEYQSASGGFSKEIYSKEKNPVTGKWDRIGIEHFTDFTTKMGNSHKPDGRYYGSAPTAFHEVMHLFGLKDWYKNPADRKAVGNNDMMHYSHSRTPIMHQIHWNNWERDIKTRQQQEGDNFILNHFVE